MLPERGEGCRCKGKTLKTVYLANIYFIYINSVVGNLYGNNVQDYVSEITSFTWLFGPSDSIFSHLNTEIEG